MRRNANGIQGNAESLSLRRAWIEIFSRTGLPVAPAGRSPYGERGLKSQSAPKLPPRTSRSPYGERGLKYPRRRRRAGLRWSLSLRRAWIEIPSRVFRDQVGEVALLTESVD